MDGPLPPPAQKSLGAGARHRRVVLEQSRECAHRLLGGALSKVLTMAPAPRREVFRGHGRISLEERHGLLLTATSVKLKLNHSTLDSLAALCSFESLELRKTFHIHDLPDLSGGSLMLDMPGSGHRRSLYKGWCLHWCWWRQCKGWWTRRYREIAADTDWSETSDQGRRTHSVGEIKSQVTAVTK